MTAELSERAQSKVDATATGAEQKLDAFLKSLPDDFPDDAVIFLTELGEQVVDIVTARSRAYQLCDLPPLDVHKAEFEAVMVEYRKLKRRESEARATLLAAHAGDGIRELPTFHDRAATPRTVPETVPTADSDTAPELDTLAPGSKITPEQKQVLVDRRQAAVDRAVKARDAIEARAKRPLTRTQSERLLASLEAELLAARAKRKRARGDKLAEAEREYKTLHGHVKAVRSAWNVCPDRSAFDAPGWKRRMPESLRAELDAATATLKQARRDLSNLTRMFDRQLAEYGHYRKPSNGGRHTPLVPKSPKPRKRKYRLTAADQQLGRHTVLVNKVRNKDWCALLLWPAEEVDAIQARTLMDRINPDPSRFPSYGPGEQLYVLQPAFTGPIKLLHYLHADLSHADYSRATKGAYAEWVDAGSPKNELQGTYQPKWFRELPPCLLHHVVYLPGSQKWAIAHRHLPRLLEMFADRKFEYRVLEFPAAPIFTAKKVRVAKNGDGPRTDAGHASLAGVEESHLADALDKGLAVLRYAPSAEVAEKFRDGVDPHAERVAGKLAERRTRKPAPTETSNA